MSKEEILYLINKKKIKNINKFTLTIYNPKKSIN